MREISIIKERILQYLDFKGVNKRVFYEKTGISNGILSQKNGISEESILKFLNYFTDIDSDWLLTGKGEMLKETSIAKPSINGIPLIPTEAFAGLGSGPISIMEIDIQDRYMVPDFTNVDFMIRVKGSSMYPKYNSGDVIACRMLKESTFIQWNHVHVIHTNEQGALVKRLCATKNKDVIQCVSDNPKYPPFEVPKKEITNIALVVGVIRLE